MASVTVEAALVLPVFFLAILTFIFMIRIAGCQDDVFWALVRTAKEAAVQEALYENTTSISRGYMTVKVNQYVENCNGYIRLTKSKIMEENSEIDLIAEYEIPLPVALFSIRSVPVKQRVKTRAFVGVEERSSETGANEIVYITKSGRVYHRKKNCTYLNLTISWIKYQDLSGIRNESGGKYKACHSCCKNKKYKQNDRVYIANYGDRFHSSKTCCRIVRTIEKIKKTEVGSRLPCSKCGEE